MTLNGWQHDVDADPRPTGRVLPRPAPIGAAVVGCGYWGPNLVRNLSETPEFHLHALCDQDPGPLRTLGRRYPQARTLGDFDEVLDDERVKAVVIATPPTTHAALAKRALLAGKHVLVEKPLATRLSDALEIVALARDSGLMLMPGHTFIYSPAVNTVRKLIADGVVGEIHFVTSSRMNLGKYQRDGVVCDLLPHDLSIMLYCLDERVVDVAASGSCVFTEGVPETAFVTLTFAGGSTANVQLSWLAPRKVRQMIVVGSKRMVQYDDTAADEPVRIYDRGIDVAAPSSFGEHQLVYRTGDVSIPRVDAREPLSLELKDFAHAIRTGEEPRSNVSIGLDIVRAVEMAETSMQQNGAPQSCLLHDERVAASAVA
jgi:predicted dehydrogenase